MQPPGGTCSQCCMVNEVIHSALLCCSRWEDLNREEVDYIQGDKHKVDFVTPIETPEVLECPVAPEGLSRLLPEVLQLLDQVCVGGDPCFHASCSCW